MKYENIIISPHIDDAFFSLGGLLLRDMGEQQKIVNVFSVSDYTLSGRMDPKKVTKVRMEEERRNIKKIGADVDFLAFSNIGSAAHSRKTEAKIRTRLGRYIKEGRRIFFPLGIGGHGDHVLLARAGLEFAKLSGNVYLYEDLPYAVRGTRLFQLIAGFVKVNGDDVFPVVNPREHRDALKEEYVKFSYERKLDLCKSYGSQVNWRILAATLGYGRMLGGLFGCRERVWKTVHPERL